MAYLNSNQLKDLDFKYLGKNVQISDKAAIYDAHKITLGDNCRIDDFCIISGKVSIGDYCHVTPMCLIAGGELGVNIGDYSTLAYGVKVFSQSDDYSGETMVNSLIPKKYKAEFISTVVIEKYCVLGANTVVMPGVTLSEGTASGAMTLFTKSSDEWGLYLGSPARRIKDRKKKLLQMLKEFKESDDDSI
jgi:acetyltransferase-like isoleucine patch superfamily enzyme